MIEQVTIVVRDGESEYVQRGPPSRVCSACYDRACRTMRLLNARHGPLGLGVSEHPDAVAWRVWNEAALRQIVWNPDYPNPSLRTRWFRVRVP